MVLQIFRAGLIILVSLLVMILGSPKCAGALLTRPQAESGLEVLGSGIHGHSYLAPIGSFCKIAANFLLPHEADTD